MSGVLPETPFDLTEAVRNLVTEDDEPVDSLLAEKQQRLLAAVLYESWTPPPDPDPDADPDAAAADPAQPRVFWASANVAIFRSVHLPPIVPDLFISLDVVTPPNPRSGDQRSYFVWEHGKVPEVVLEIVSNRKGKELGSKLRDYARLGINYYVVYDPFGALRKELGGAELLVYEFGFGKRYRPRKDYRLPDVGLSLAFWEGQFEDSTECWLRWCDDAGNLLLTGHEHAAQAEARAAQAEGRAAQAEGRAAQAEERTARLAAKLRELGLDPEQV